MNKVNQSETNNNTNQLQQEETVKKEIEQQVEEIVNEPQEEQEEISVNAQTETVLSSEKEKKKESNEKKMKYNCQICNKKSQMKNHHETHLQSDKHKNKVELKRMHLNLLKKKNLEKYYNSSNIDSIIKKLTTEKIIIKKNIQEFKKQKKINKVIFKKSTESNYNTHKEESFKKKFLDFINKMHNLLRGSAVTGSDALDDILNTLLLCNLFQRNLYEGNYDIGNSLKNCYKGIIQRKVKDFIKFLDYKYLTEHIEELRIKTSKNSIQKIGELLSRHPITKNIITNSDFINCQDEKTLAKLIKECYEFSKKENIFTHVDLCGIAYEYITTKHAGNGGTSKEMGQYFTERPLMYMCFQLIDKQDIIDLKIDDNSTIGDEFCATFGFPITLKKFLKDNYSINIQDKNMYGVEYHERLSKLAFMNAMFSISNLKNIKRGNSFITNVKPHLDISVHNVPFGKSMTPKIIKEIYEEFLKENPGKGYPTVQEYLPYCNKKIDSIIASQVVLYKTRKMGLLIIKDGEETSGTKNWKYRKWFGENCIIKKIMKIPSGAFSCTGTKTVCIYFIKKKGEMTENIQFLELSESGDKIIEISNVSKSELKQNNYSWNHNDYLLDEKMAALMEKSSCEWKQLYEIYEFNKKSKRKANYGKKIGKYPFYTSSNKLKLYVDNPDYNKESLIIGDGGSANINFGINFSVSDHCFVLNSKLPNVLTKYNYYYIKFNLNILNKLYNGSGLKNISKTKLKKLNIPIPPLQIQTEIIKILDDLSEQKNLLMSRKNGIQRQMKYYLEYQTKINPNNILKLDNLIKCQRGNLGKPNEDKSKNIYPYYAGKSIIGYLDKYEFCGESFIVNYRVNKNIIDQKKFNICQFIKGGKYNCSRFSWVITLKNNNYMLKYIYYYMDNLVDYTNRITGSIPEINGTNLKNIDIILQKDKEKQTEIIQYLDELEDEKNKIDNKITKIDQLMKSILEQSYL
jgi:restriction endonuclease S subunit